VALRKRVKLTGTGRLRRYHAYKSHILTKKHPSGSVICASRRWCRRPTSAGLKRLLMV